MIDPGVELLADIPISGASEDLLARAPIAERLAELACAEPLAAPRAVGLVGGSGSGKTSILRITTELLIARGDVAVVPLDAAGYSGAAQLMDAMLAALTEFFSAAGVVDTSDSIRDRLARYASEPPGEPAPLG